jgi:hypothetical protein
MDALTAFIVLGLIGFVGALIWLVYKTHGGTDFLDTDIDD